MTSIFTDKSALVVGAGGLGGPVLLALGAAGVGRIVFCDDDQVETSNLNRQPLFGEEDLGARKAAAAERRLRHLFPSLRIEAIDGRFDRENAVEWIRSADVVLDGSDNFGTKFLASDAAILAGRPLVHGGVLRFTSQILTVLPGQTACLRCLFEVPPEPGTVPTCATAGILGGVAGFAGSLMAAEALRLLAGRPAAYAGRLLICEAQPARSRRITVPRRVGCAACEGRLPLESSARPQTCAPGRPDRSKGDVPGGPV